MLSKRERYTIAVMSLVFITISDCPLHPPPPELTILSVWPGMRAPLRILGRGGHCVSSESSLGVPSFGVVRLPSRLHGNIFPFLPSSWLPDHKPCRTGISNIFALASLCYPPSSRVVELTGASRSLSLHMQRGKFTGEVRINEAHINAGHGGLMGLPQPARSFP